MPKYYRPSTSARARALALAAIQQRALMPNSVFQRAQADQLRRRQLARRVFSRFRAMKALGGIRNQEKRLKAMRARYIVNLALARQRGYR